MQKVAGKGDVATAVAVFHQSAADMKKYAPAGIKFVRQKITPENMGKVLSQHVDKGGLLIDLAWNIDACEILQWCHDNGVRYINTSTELWDPYKSGSHPTEKTL